MTSPTPSKPLPIVSPKLRSESPFSGSPVGTPDLRALRAGYVGTPPVVPNIPTRGSGSPVPRVLSHNAQFNAEFDASPIPSPRFGRLHRPTDTPDTGLLDIDDLPEEEKLRVLRKHLVSKEERLRIHDSGSRTPHSIADSATGAHLSSRHGSSASLSINRQRREDTEPFPVPYHAPGADVTHDIYKWQSDQRKQANRSRAASFSGAVSTPLHPAFEHIHEPGGFRRNYMLLRANELGSEGHPHLNNFIDFLFLFGHFAGEDLEEEEEADDQDSHLPVTSREIQDVDERRPLLERSGSWSRSRRRRDSVTEKGDATVTQAVLMLLKSFIGTGVLFLGKAFFNGGFLFSTVCLCFIAMISLYSFLLLVRTKFVVPGSYGDIGGKLYGPWLRLAILSSIAISQIGFVAAYTIFVAENLQAFALAVTKCSTALPVQYFIIVQLLVFLPLALIRSLAKLSTTALIADVFILMGLLYIFGSEFAIISANGIADIAMFNANDWPLFIGTAVFSFEGIGLVLPITDTMREPRKFPAVLTGVMVFLMFLFGGAGALSYLTFGKEVHPLVIVNLDGNSKMVQAVQFIYSMAILLSVPLQLFPAVRIMEHGLFPATASGKADPRVKWRKNFFRFAVVMMCTTISWFGAADLDKFVALVGSFACVPLCYIYPAMLHYKGCARTRKQKVADVALMTFGVVATIYTTLQTVRLMLDPKRTSGHQFGKCGVPPQ